MRIKSSPRVIYDHNPLVEVVCQARFDRNLQLQAGVPHEFQARIRETYPRLRTEQLASIQIISGPSAEPLTEPVTGRQSSVSTIYHFSSEDQERTISVSADFLSFGCTKYVRWENFKAEFISALNAFTDIYPHPVIQRLGLRYKDLIERESIGLTGVEWSELLSPIVAGVFSADNFFDQPLTTPDERSIRQTSQSVLMLEECGLLLQSALMSSFGEAPTYAFLIDTDFFHEHPQHSVALEKTSESLEILHKNADAIFRACIKDRLHHALGPRPIEN